MQRRPSVVLITAIVAASIVALALGRVLPLFWLTVSGQVGPATVVKVDCQPGQKHHIQYSFQVGHYSIDDVGPDGYGNPNCQSLKKGENGIVTYLIDEPKIHEWGRASEYLSERLSAAVIALIFIPLSTFFAVRKRIDALK